MTGTTTFSCLVGRGVLSFHAATPSFGSKWLVPRLDSFYASNPDINVRIDASTRLADFHTEDVEIAIRYGSGD